MLNFDNAATTKISEKSLQAYVTASETFFNPSSLYVKALESKKLIDNARNYILKKLNAKIGSTLIFTGCATESNNSVLNACITRKDKKYLISAGEHSSVHETAKYYNELGYNVVFIPLKHNGGIDEQALYEELDETVAFVSIIHVSNETGAINDIKSITKKIKEYNPNILVHSDGVQAIGKLSVNLKEFGVDFYTISAHKINGPKGIGALYIANPNKFKPLLHGGGQEMKLRAGTENIPAIVAFQSAFEELSITDFSLHKKAILDNLVGDFVLVSDENCVDNIISVCFKGIRSETILHILEESDILVGTGSACNSKAGKNRVLSQIVSKDYIDGAVRLSFGDEISVEDCVFATKKLTEAVKKYTITIRK
ncbi:MAG: cysteine desulfurase [Clostridia bacterium]|nr:cysteine desulfurase [Clostridia bacterium]